MSLLKKLHHALPPGIRKSYRFIVILLEKLKQRYLPVSRYTCYPDDSGASLSFVYTGWDPKLCYYWLSRIGGSSKREPGGKRISRSRLPGYVRKMQTQADLFILETGAKSLPDSYDGGFLLPRWMELEVDIETSLKTSRVKNITRNIRKHSLEYEIRTGSDAFDLFYHRMYVPFSKKRHGESADISDYKHFSGKYSKGSSELFFILKEGEPVASAYIEVRESSCRVSAFGVLEASEEIFRMGVIGALYYFVMMYYKERGMRKILVGNSMAVAFDGVTEFKTQIGAKPFGLDLPEKEKYYVIPRFSNPLIMNLFRSNPLIGLSGSGPQLAVFTDDSDFTDRDHFIRYTKRLKMRNYHKTVFYYLDKADRIREWMGPESTVVTQFVHLSQTHDPR